MFINIDNVNVHYTVKGEGADIVLLHGWGVDSRTFTRLQDNLMKHFKVYAIDFPGFGLSEEPPAPWGVTEYTQLVQKFMQKLDITNPILIGHSFGGRISIKYASENKVKKIVLVNSAGIKPKRSLSYYVKVYSYKFVKNVFKLPGLRRFSDQVLTHMKSKVGSSDYKNVSGVMQQTLVKVVNEDLRSLLPKITCPTLLIWGEHDTATPVSDAKIMESLLPDAGLVVLNNVGHFSYLEKPVEFEIIVNKFLENERNH